MKACFAIPNREALFAQCARRAPVRAAFEFFGAAVEVRASSEALIERLRRVYRHFSVARAVPSARLILLEPGAGFDDYVLLADWFGWGMRIANDALLHYYASKLLRLWVAERSDPEYATLHAASLAGPSGGGVVLIGEAAAGKTTLTLRLLERGFRYLSDDTTVIRRRDLTCVPFPMAFVLRAGEGQPDIALLDEPRWLLERWDASGAAFAPTVLYFLGDHPALGPGGFRRISPVETALRVLRNLVMPLGSDASAYTAAPQNFDFACRLALAADGTEMSSNDLDRALDALVADYRLRFPIRSEGAA
ncbi:MAG: hypothetical protein JO036_06615 [Candidatus Eremiobacteraeota bacterium]|nr:hypothetical protein [Candidatus Eremiobacteraeota bacterium]